MISDMFKFLKHHISKRIMPGLLPAQEVKGITLLSKEEYLEARDIVPRLDGWWWLRSPGYLGFQAAVVVYGGDVDVYGSDVGLTCVSVRPALRLNPKSVDLQIGEKVRIAGHTWTIIPGNLALCDEFIGMHCFRKDSEAPDANDYEASDIKRFIEYWAGEHGLLPKEITPSDIAGITLLSLEEYLKAEDIAPKLGSWWWLRSPGYDSRGAAVVLPDGRVIDNGNFVVSAGGSVRPALRLNPESDNLQIGDRVLAAGHTWTVIPGNLALCDGSIGEHCFRKDSEAPDANNYEASDIKQFLENWARENGLLPKEICARDVAGITLLSAEEYLKAEDIVPKLDGWWWLRSPGYLGFQAAVVVYGGDVDVYGSDVGLTCVSVRPALRLNPKSVDLQIGEKVRIAGHTWTIIPGGLALCDEFIGKHCFRKDSEAPDANIYERSDVKKFLEGWARKRGLLQEGAGVPRVCRRPGEEGIYMVKDKAKFDILKRIDDEKKKRGWTDSALAAHSGLPQSTLSTWRRLDLQPSVASIEKICRGFGMTLSEFFAEGDGPAQNRRMNQSQMEFMDKWDRLGPAQKSSLSAFIDTIVSC